MSDIKQGRRRRFKLHRLVLTLGAAILAIVVGSCIFMHVKYSNWKEEQARITNIHCGIEYVYNEDLKESQNLNICHTYYQYFYENKVYEQEIRTQDKSRYKIGEKFTVRVNPKKPSEDMRPSVWNNLLLILIALAGGGVIFLGIKLWLKARAERAERRAAREAEKAQNNSEQPAPDSAQNTEKPEENSVNTENSEQLQQPQTAETENAPQTQETSDTPDLSDSHENIAPEASAAESEPQNPDDSASASISTDETDKDSDEGSKG